MVFMLRVCGRDIVVVVESGILSVHAPGVFWPTCKDRSKQL